MAVVKRLFWQLGWALVAVAIVGRWLLLRGYDKNKCMDLLLGQKKMSGHCREEIVSGGSTV